LICLQDKAMMGRWGLAGMQSFEQVSVAQKEGFNHSSSGVAAEAATS
jgi:hypothetical protein